MDIFSVFTLLGGVGLFLYGISLLGSSLEKLAGSGLEKILERLTTSKKKGVGALKGFGLGVGVTGIIQSSAATTVMLIGFVNAGIMTLIQAIPVVYGANIGSTVTAQILRLGDLGEGSFILKMLKPSSFAPIIIAIGAFILLLTKKKKLKDVANILIGFGILFVGMTTMENVFEPLRESTAFQNAFTSFANPLLGVGIGLVITAIIQSSSASVGILQAISSTGSVTYATAIPIIIGQNIGKCMTILLGSIGTNKKAKRVSLSYLLFNIFGAAFFLIVIYGINAIRPFGFLDATVNRGDIANIHLAFNLITSLVLLPLTKQMSELTGKLIQDTGEDDKLSKELSTLDPLLLNTPTVAIEQCSKVMNSMCDAIMENYRLSTDMIYHYDEKNLSKLDENESFIDKCESALSEYLLQITSKRLTPADRKRASELLNCISDFERMGDHCVNISYVARSKNEQNIHFSSKGHKEVELITSAVEATLHTTFEAFRNDDTVAASRVEPLEETIDIMKETIKSHHIERLQSGDCGIQGGIALVDLVTSYERISSHCANVALHIVKKVSNIEGFDDMHGHITDHKNRSTEEYKAMLLYYHAKYIDPMGSALPEAETASESAAVTKDTAVATDKAATTNTAGTTDTIETTDNTGTTDNAGTTDNTETTDAIETTDNTVAANKAATTAATDAGADKTANKTEKHTHANAVKEHIEKRKEEISKKKDTAGKSGSDKKNSTDKKHDTAAKSDKASKEASAKNASGKEASAKNTSSKNASGKKKASETKKKHK